MNVRTMGLLKLLFAGIIIMVAGILIMAHTGSFLLIVMISAGIGVFFDGIYTLFGIGRWKLTGATKVLAIIKGICNILEYDLRFIRLIFVALLDLLVDLSNKSIPYSFIG